MCERDSSGTLATKAQQPAHIGTYGRQVGAVARELAAGVGRCLCPITLLQSSSVGVLAHGEESRWRSDPELIGCRGDSQSRDVCGGI
jgi:hypothetical protein